MQFLNTKATIFAVLMHSLYGQPKYFKFKPKYQQIGPVFSDYLSVFYDYGARNFGEYFHLYSIAGQKFKMKEILKKEIKQLHAITVSCFVARKIAVSAW